MSVPIVSSNVTPVNDETLAAFSSLEEGLILLLEQVHAASCSNPARPMMRGWSPIERKAVFFRPRCKLWSCPSCALINRAYWAATAIHACNYFRNVGIAINFVTLTSHEKLAPAKALAVLPHSWKLLRMRVSRASPGWAYLIVPEFTQRGVVHLHGLVTADLTKKWWKDNARSCGMGYQSDVKEVVNVGGAGGYVTKYITKSLENRNVGKGFRHVRTSQNLPRLPDMHPPDGWLFAALPHDVSLAEEVRRWQDRGYTVALGDGVSAWDFVEGKIKAPGSPTGA